MTADADLGLIVRHVPVEMTIALRDAMLSPGHPGRPVTADYDYFDGAIHLGLFASSDELVGCVSASPMPFDDSDPLHSYRFHSMAISETHQGTGLGRHLLRALYAELQEHGASLVWATARPSAVGFYRRMGLSVLDKPGTVPETGMEIWYVVSDSSEIGQVASDSESITQIHFDQ